MVGREFLGTGYNKSTRRLKLSDKVVAVISIPIGQPTNTYTIKVRMLVEVVLFCMAKLVTIERG